MAVTVIQVSCFKFTVLPVIQPNYACQLVAYGAGMLLVCWDWKRGTQTVVPGNHQLISALTFAPGSFVLCL